MKEYRQLKNKIRQRAEILEETIQEMAELGLVEDAQTSLWKVQLDRVKGSLEDMLLRIAVVGSVKSGKSTLINALAGGDLLRRGAGIVTSCITRIHTNGTPGGWVELKPWPQVLLELNETLRMLPASGELVDESERLDLRRDEDRERLRLCLERMQNDWRQPQGQLDPSFFLIRNYLEGYDFLHHSLGESATRIVFDEKSLAQHQYYVGHEGQVVYVHDMELQYPIPWLEKKIEIADCQGSDSPNPVHLERVQQYMLSCHFIFYVISSRTGLREADFKLLNFIKTLRMLPQTLFILNVDLDDHPDEKDLEGLIERVRTELGWIVPDPQLHTFSALYHLMAQLEEGLPTRERRHFELWKGERALVECMEKGVSQFQSHVVEKISGQRVRVLLGSGLSRLSMVAGSVLDTASAQKGFMDRKLSSLEESAAQLKSRQMALQATLGTLENAISGLRDSLEREVAQAVDQFFDLNEGPIIKETMDMVDHYPVDSHYRKELGDYRRLLRQLYRFYLEFRQSLARYLVERVNTRVVEFARDQEAFIQERLNQSARAFWSLFMTAVSDYRRQVAPYNIELHTPGEMHEWEWTLAEKLVPPTFSAFVDQEALGRGVLLVKFGLGRFSRFLMTLTSRMGKRKGFPVREREPDEEARIDEAMDLVKSESKSELLDAFVQYRKHFKFGYLFQVLEEGARHLLEEFRTRTQMARLDFESLMKQSGVEGEKRQSLVESLTRAGHISQAMMEELEELRCAMDLK